MNLEDYFRGLSDPTRLRIMNLLLRSELCGCDLQRALEIPQASASRHLIYLRRSGLVLDRREGYRVYYRLAEGGSLRSLYAYLRHELRRIFSSDLERLQRLQAAAPAPAGGKPAFSIAKRGNPMKSVHR